MENWRKGILEYWGIGSFHYSILIPPSLPYPNSDDFIKKLQMQGVQKLRREAP
jgi:hypothetical protein